VLLSKVNLLSDACLQILIFALKHLVVGGDGSNLTTVLDNALVSGGDLLLDCHGLLRNFRSLDRFVFILRFEVLELLREAIDKAVLVIHLILVITL
jgi:hypothetical protein